MRTLEGPIARARGLVKRFGEVEAVRGIDFTIQPRECYGFLGPNGAGKSTTIRMLTCRIPRTAGELEVLGHDVDQAPEAIKSQMGVVSQENNLDESLTIWENLYVYGRYHGLSGREAARRSDELLQFMQLETKARFRPMHLSGGMKRRLAIARALVNRPRLVVLDEPTTGLDPQARLLVWQRLAALKAQGVTLILTTHYMEEAARLCDRVAIFDQGRVVAEDTPDALVARHSGQVVVELERWEGDIPQDAGALAGSPLRRVEPIAGSLYLYGDDGHAILDWLTTHGVRPISFRVRPATLEDVFLVLTGKELREL
ncbi:MAG TPA: ABC transporter ATP-binding protein [Limnochorda sp.]